MRVPTPWGPVRLDPGPLLTVVADDTRAALWCLGRHQGRTWPETVARGLAVGAGRASRDDPRARLRDDLHRALNVGGRARRLLAAAPPLFRRHWHAFAAGLAASRARWPAGAARPTAGHLAAWDLLLASLPEAGALLGGGPELASNGAALSGERVYGGGGMLWWDPHVPLRVQGELRLDGALIRSPGYTACGLLRVGSPFVLVGSGPARAWTLCASAEALTRRGASALGRRPGWWRRPGERHALRPAFLDCVLPALWSWRAARGASATALINQTVYHPPLAHTHLVVADAAGRIGYGLALAGHPDRPRPRSRGEEGGWLVQCNAGWARVEGEPPPGAPAGACYRSWRHRRARAGLAALLARRGRVAPADLLPLVREEHDPALAHLADRLRRVAPAGELAHWRGGVGRRSRLATLAVLTAGELTRGGGGGDPHLVDDLVARLAATPDGAVRRAFTRARRRWLRLERPPWGAVHGGRGGTLDTLLAAGGSPWTGPPWPADAGSLLPGVVRLRPTGTVILLPGTEGGEGCRQVRLSPRGGARPPAARS